MAVWLWNFWIFSFWGWCLGGCLPPFTPPPAAAALPAGFAPVYGLGMAAVLALPAPLLSGWRLYVFGSLAATAVEYLYHWWAIAFCASASGTIPMFPAISGGRVCLPLFSGMGAADVPGGKAGRPGSRRADPAVPPLLTWLCLMGFTADAVCSSRFLAVTHDLNALRYAF